MRGTAYDFGVSAELPFKFKPYLTLGLAQGSGDPPATPGREGAFRQSGLHANNEVGTIGPLKARADEL